MLMTTTGSLAGYRMVAEHGIVEANIVQSKHLGRDIAAGLKSLVGGEIRGYSEMMTEARSKAKRRLIQQAEAVGANAVVGLRYATSSIAAGMCEILVFGTAVTVQREG
ncbi:MAG: hypothetical protein ACI8UD_002349 [Planctomycetota bacterium]|jgi:uncharacterized protein YbjQ (UPF0145 family)